MRYGAHRPMQHDQGFTRSHWTPPSGNYSLRIAPAAARATINSMIMKHVPTLLAVLMAIAMRRYYTKRIAQWRRFVAFIKATKRHYRASTRSDSVFRSIKFRLFFCSSESLKKNSSCPNNNRGVTYQSNGKDLADGMEYLNRGAKIVC